MKMQLRGYEGPQGHLTVAVTVLCKMNPTAHDMVIHLRDMRRGTCRLGNSGVLYITRIDRPDGEQSGPV